MELLLLLLAAGAAGAVAMMPDDSEAEGTDADPANEVDGHPDEDGDGIPNFVEDEENRTHEAPDDITYVENAELHDMTKLAFHRWEVNPEPRFDSSLMDNPPEDAVVVEHHVQGASERLSIGKGLNFEDSVDDAPQIMRVYGSDNTESEYNYDETIYLEITKGQAQHDHAFAIYGGDGDDFLKPYQIGGGYHKFGDATVANGVAYGGAGNDKLAGGAAVENYGGSGDDIFFTDEGAKYYGGEGDDLFYLRQSIAERGDWDTLPQIYGGEGSDKFEITPFAVQSDRASAIHDFETGVDKLYFNSFDPASVVINETDDGTEIVMHNAQRDFDHIVWLDGVSNFTENDIVFGPHATGDTSMHYK